MTAQTTDEDLDDLLPDDLLDGPVPKGRAVPLVRSPAKTKALVQQTKKEQAQAIEKANAVRLAQIVNLHIAGFSLAEIGASVGASADEIERLLTSDVGRYVRTQPALRTYVRNWISKKYMTMIEADWDAASDKDAAEKLENQDRVMRMLDRMAKLHGAEMPTQSEIKVETAPEAVEKLVNALAASKGLGYDDSVFDIVDADVVEDAVAETDDALAVSGNAVEESDGDDAL